MFAARRVLWILLTTVDVLQALPLTHISKVLLQSKFSSVGEHRHQPGVGAYSLCKDGKLLPQLYLLGAAKSGTTSIASYLNQTGILPQSPNGTKEWHFFDRKYDDVQDVTPEFLEGLRSAWMDELPACTPEEEPRITGDFTPDNLGLVPKPEGWVGRTTHADLPLTLQYFYGEELYPKLTFAVTMRDPLERIQSGWYFNNSRFDLVPECTFEEYVREVLRNASHDSRYNYRLWQSMYGLQLKGWLDRYEARQFIFAPMIVAMNEEATILRSLSAHLGMPLETSGKHLHSNPSTHPSLSEDLSPDTIAMFNRFMEDDHRLLLEELAKASLEGASLAGYSGSLGDKREIEAWLGF